MPTNKRHILLVPLGLIVVPAIIWVTLKGGSRPSQDEAVSPVLARFVNLEGTQAAMLAKTFISEASMPAIGSNQSLAAKPKEVLLSTGVTQPDGTVLFPEKVAVQLREDARLEAERGIAIQRAEQARLKAQTEYLRTAK